MTRPALFLALTAAVVTAVLAGCATPNQNGLGPAPAAPAGITVRGTGEVVSTPDIATIDLGVNTRAPSAQAALAENNQKSTDLLAQLRGKGVADADLRTSNLSVNPTFEHNSGRISGYEVNNQVTVTIRDIAAAGEIIDAAAQAAGDAVRVQGLSFGIDDASAQRAEARRKAVQLAQAQAKQLADAAGVQLGAVRTIVEVPQGGQPPVPMLRADESAAAGMPVQPGTQKLMVTVEIVYAID